MNMNPIDCSKAQALLTKLVQMLSPLTVKEVSPSFLLNKRFFIPPQEWKHQTQRSVKLLNCLHAVQREVNEWVQEEGGSAQKQTKQLKLHPFHRKREEISPSIAKQAKVLVNQVHEAICEMSSSANFKAPQEAPLREALRKLKPQLDRIIELLALSPSRRSYENRGPFIAPYLAPLLQRNLLQKKKKRKGFWFKEEERDESDKS